MHLCIILLISHSGDILSQIKDTLLQSQLALVKTSKAHDQITHILFGGEEGKVLCQGVGGQLKNAKSLL